MTKISPYLKENKMIDDIIENFDFFKCYSIMNVLNWKWRGDRVTIEMLKSSAVNRLRSAIDGVKDKENKTSNEYSISVGTTDKVFSMNFKVENIKIIPGKYDVVISNKGISKFTNVNRNLVYYIALEPNSTFE